MQESGVAERSLGRLGRQKENSTPGWEHLPRERQFKDPLEKLCTNKKATEDRDEWMEEARSTAKVVVTTRVSRRCRKRRFRNNEDGVRNHESLVWKKIQRRLSCLCSVENYTFGFHREARGEAAERDSWVSGHRADDSIGRMVRGSDGRAVASQSRSSESNCLHVGTERRVNCEHVQT